MPCAGPSQYEIAQDERSFNHRTMGYAWTNSEWAENTACAYTAFVRHKKELPKWAILWSDEHEKRDKQRQQELKNRESEERDRKLRAYNKLKKELGM